MSTLTRTGLGKTAHRWIATLTLATVVSCLPNRDIGRTPIQGTRPRPLTVKTDAWPAVMKMLLLQGDLIQSPERSLNRVEFRRPLTKATLPVICDLTTIQSLDPESWQFSRGSIDVAIWIDEEGDRSTTQLNMEGTCRAVFDPPKWRALLAPLPLQLPALILSGGDFYRPQSVVFSSKGELERELQAQIVTTLGLDLPPSLTKQ